MILNHRHFDARKSNSKIYYWDLKQLLILCFFFSLQGIAKKWHEHLQIYLASFTVLYKRQLQDDTQFNNHTFSPELKNLRDNARELLCDIEHFVNATSNKNGEQKPYWFEKEEMAKIVILREKKILNNLFVKARFQQYIEKLCKRIKHFNLQRNLQPKALKPRRYTTTLKPRRSRKNKMNRRRTTLDYTGEPTTTETTFIITTRRNRKNTRTPRQGMKKHNRVNQNLWIILIQLSPPSNQLIHEPSSYFPLKEKKLLTRVIIVHPSLN